MSQLENLAVLQEIASAHQINVNLKNPLPLDVQLQYMLRWERDLRLPPPAKAQLRQAIVDVQTQLFHHRGP